MRIDGRNHRDLSRTHGVSDGVVEAVTYFCETSVETIAFPRRRACSNHLTEPIMIIHTNPEGTDCCSQMKEHPLKVVSDNAMDHRKGEGRGFHICCRSRMVCLCFTLTAALIGCQFGNVFVPEVFLAVMGRSLRHQQEQPFAMRKFLNEAERLESRELERKAHARVRREGRKETRRQRRERKKAEDRKWIEEQRQKAKEEAKLIKSGAKNVTVECLEPREPVWEFEDFGKNASMKASKRLLIGLYSGWGVYSQLLSKTAHVNRAYARHWHHDVVLVQGAALRLKDLDGDCEPPPHRATYDKIPLLQYALEHKDSYDQLLILDTDALMYEMDVDVTTLLPEGRMLAAHKVHPGDVDQTWDINAGVTLWDLHHPRTERLAKEWLKNSKSGMENDYHASNDQYHLHYTLQSGNYQDDIQAFDNEFNYGHGTLVKHFIRKPRHKQWGQAAILDNRENRIDEAIEEVCKEHRAICGAVERKTYVE